MFNLFKKKAPASEQALRIHIKLSDDNMGTEPEREALFKFENHLAAAVEKIGEFDGNDFGGGFCTLYLYGPDVHQLEQAIRPVLAKHPLPSGSYLIKRAGSVDAPEERVEL